MSQERLSYTNHIKTLYKTTILLMQKKAEQATYRVVKMPDANDRTIHFQVTGKNIVLNMLPEEIMRDNILMEFSRADVALITHLGTKQEIMSMPGRLQNKLFKIIKQIFSSGKTKFIIEKENGEVSEHAANELLNEPTMIEKLTPNDAIKIGYTAAEEHYTKLIKLKNE